MSPALQLEGVEIALRYQPSILRYEAEGAAYIEHGTGTSVWFAASRELELSLDADLLRGGDVDFFVAQGVLTWRTGI